MMYGAEDIVSYRPDIHLYSSTGLDVTQLPVNIIHFLDRQIRKQIWALDTSQRSSVSSCSTTTRCTAVARRCSPSAFNTR